MVTRLSNSGYYCHLCGQHEEVCHCLKDDRETNQNFEDMYYPDNEDNEPEMQQTQEEF